MFLLGNVWLVLLKTGFMFLRKKKKEPNLFLFFHVLVFSEIINTNMPEENNINVICNKFSDLVFGIKPDAVNHRGRL